MTAQEYIQSKLDDLQRSHPSAKPDADELADTIYRLVMSKKFRKYRVNPEYQQHIRSAINQNIERGEPIKVAFVFGGYKLWRLHEAPEVDWAELFSIMYYAQWITPMCQIYKPGVWFDFFSDDAIVAQLNNVPADWQQIYRQGFESLLAFVRERLPGNASMTYHRVGDQYDSLEAFNADVAEQLQKLKQTLPGGLPELTDEMRAAIELNVQLKPGQADDPLWREKVQLLHDAYAQVDKRRPYYRTNDKIMVITRPIPNTLALGTTKSSVMKFWIGAGALQSKDDSYQQVILSPSQLEKAKYTWQDVRINGLAGKNFSKIRVL